MSIPPFLLPFLRPPRQPAIAMERQKSFPIKPSKLLLILCSIISSSLIFCFLFSFQLLHTTTTPSDPKVAHLHLKGGNSNTSSLLNDENKNPTFLDPIFSLSANLSFEALINEAKDEISLDAQVKDTTFEERDGVGAVHASDGEAPNLVEDENFTTILASLDGKIAKKDNVFVSEEAKKEKALHHISVRSKTSGECDISKGRWAFDDSYPLYTSNSCPFIDEGFNCEANGRSDKNYMKWRWMPIACDIPRFDPVKMLELIRGKRLVFVGDSMNRNQWESMLCLLRGAISDPTRVYEARGRRITKYRGNYNFKFPDYDCSVEFYVSHYLVREGRARVGQPRAKTLRIDSIDRSSSRWKGAEILVFNTAHWWSHHKTKSGKNYYQEGSQVHSHLDAHSAFRKALTTWATWIDQHVDPRKTRVFFRSSSPSHFSGGEWNSGGHCKESNQPLNDTKYRQVPEKNIILQQVVEQMRNLVTVLNITNLSGLRIDGHPSVYGIKPEKGTGRSIQDCSHWCLPGVPDAWNELLYYHLRLSTQS